MTATVAETLRPLVERLDPRLARPRDVTLRFWDGSVLPAAQGGPDPTIVVRRPRALAHVVHEPGELGLGRAWVAGDLDVEGDLERALRARECFRGVRITLGDKLAALRAARALGVLRPPGPRPPASEVPVRRGRRHTPRRDRQAVRHHYDVPEAFYRILLGPSMVYSCAYFDSPDDSLEDAQERKLEVICRKLRLSEGDRLLDIGCGWGALMIHAAREHGVRAVGVTLSEPQAALARERIRAADLADRCEVRVADYREIDDGPYDKVASVGMYEHVGEARLQDYVARVARLLRPGGLFLNHGIVGLGPGRVSPKSFAVRYVFPDGELHPVSAVIAAMERCGLEVRDAESLREHYALTLRRWAANLDADRAGAVAAAGSERERIWRLYMLGSSLSFEWGDVGIHQVLAAAPGGAHGLPLARRELLEGQPSSA